MYTQFPFGYHLLPFMYIYLYFFVLLFLFISQNESAREEFRNTKFCKNSANQLYWYADARGCY